jgi:hypothetical protein
MSRRAEAFLPCPASPSRFPSLAPPGASRPHLSRRERAGAKATSQPGAPPPRPTAKFGKGSCTPLALHLPKSPTHPSLSHSLATTVTMTKTLQWEDTRMYMGAYAEPRRILD